MANCTTWRVKSDDRFFRGAKEFKRPEGVTNREIDMIIDMVRGHDEMTQVDDMFINYYDSKKVNWEFLLQMVILLTKKVIAYLVLHLQRQRKVERKYQHNYQILKLVQQEAKNIN